MKKILLFLLAAVLTFTILAVPVFADGFDLEEYEYIAGYELYFSGKAFDFRSYDDSPSTISVVSCHYNGVDYVGGTLRKTTSNGSKTYRYYDSEGVYISSSMARPFTRVVFSSAQSLSVNVVDWSSYQTVDAVPLTVTKVSAVGEGFHSALTATGSVFSFITSSALLPYVGLIIGISVLTAVLVYIKWLL